MKYDNRIKKLEKFVDGIRAKKGGFRVVIMNPVETQEQCLERHGLSGDFPGLTVLIVRWRKGITKKVGVQQTTGHEKNCIKIDSPRRDKSAPEST